MSHFARIEHGIVVQVVVAEEEFISTGALGDPAGFVQTSYNTIGGVHTQGGTPLRGNYAGVGFTYDATNDVFYAPRPKDRNGVSCDSFTIGAPTWQWVNPVAMPVEKGKFFAWDEPTKTWIDITPVETPSTPTV